MCDAAVSAGVCPQLMETISCGLEGNEYFTLLSWTQNTYPGPELLGHPSLAISTKALPPLLDKQTIDTLIKEYVEVGSGH